MIGLVGWSLASLATGAIGALASATRVTSMPAS